MPFLSLVAEPTEATNHCRMNINSCVHLYHSGISNKNFTEGAKYFYQQILASLSEEKPQITSNATKLKKITRNRKLFVWATTKVDTLQLHGNINLSLNYGIFSTQFVRERTCLFNAAFRLCTSVCSVSRRCTP